jgi:hypothetical protein
MSEVWDATGLQQHYGEGKGQRKGDQVGVMVHETSRDSAAEQGVPIPAAGTRLALHGKWVSGPVWWPHSSILHD